VGDATRQGAALVRKHTTDTGISQGTVVGCAIDLVRTVTPSHHWPPLLADAYIYHAYHVRAQDQPDGVPRLLFGRDGVWCAAAPDPALAALRSSGAADNGVVPALSLRKDCRLQLNFGSCAITSPPLPLRLARTS
jgi:hypothetical protein